MNSAAILQSASLDGDAEWSVVEGVASPSWWGVDRDRWIDAAGARTATLRRAHTDCIADDPMSNRIMTAAGEEGLVPRTYGLAADGHIIREHLAPDEWLLATDRRIRDRSALPAILRAHRSFHGIRVDAAPRHVLDEIDSLWESLSSQGFSLPETASTLRRMLLDVSGSLRDGIRPVVSHGVGPSNVLLRDGEVRLTGGLLAGRRDLSEELGSLLATYSPYIVGPEELVELYLGSWDADEHARAVLLSIADDLRWALVGFSALAYSPGTSLEYLTYSSLRLRRAHWAIASGALGNRREIR